jgi:hypothetical protein
MEQDQVLTSYTLHIVATELTRNGGIRTSSFQSVLIVVLMQVHKILHYFTLVFDLWIH